MMIEEAKEKVIDAGIKLIQSGLITRTWGNVSCRVNKDFYVITPSGRDYNTLTKDDIVLISIKNESYSGKIKPSSEKGIHTEIYKKFKNISFVIHTHQINASVISGLSIDEMRISPSNPILGDKIICADYGISSTLRLKRNIAKALKKSNCKSIIMKNHGALCFGEDDEITFKVAFELEEVCKKFLERKYLELSGNEKFDTLGMLQSALSLYAKRKVIIKKEEKANMVYSFRTLEGFDFFDENNLKIAADITNEKESRISDFSIHKAIYKSDSKVNYIINSNLENINALSQIEIILRPLIDDFAQIVGTKINIVDTNTIIKKSLIKNSNAIFIRQKGALCWGQSLMDAKATEAILEKNCKVFLWASIFGEIKFISKLDSRLMRIVYLRKYSKLKDET